MSVSEASTHLAQGRRTAWCAAGAAALVAATGCGSNAAKATARSVEAPTISSPSTTSPVAASGQEDDLGGSGAPTIAGPVVAAGSGSVAGASACRTGSPLADVYHPNRLSVVEPCMTVSGTVESVRSESDGDTHFDLAVDPPFSHLLKPANSSGQHGWLVAEIVPADQPGCTPGQPPRPSSGSYDYGICTGAGEMAPSVGQHVYVTGPYVLDEDHGGWAEIHPVWAVSDEAPTTATPGAAGTQKSGSSPTTTQPATASAGPGTMIESVTSPVKRGDTASLAATTSPDTGCDLTVTLPSGAQSRSQGLGPATSDPDGSVRWTWRTGTTTAPGTATATVTCGASSATAQFQITS
ncbi:MAG TPA: hypothetical protein VFP54_00985 [Acidimicrobiales bacterium]|nr:hypothetical protein [Acidimicrobiales bacterium]